LEYELKNINACERELEISVSPEEAKDFFNKAYNKTAPRVDIKGFRKGKVPRNMIMKLYGPQIEAEANLDATNHFLQQITKENQIRILSQPSLEDVIKEDNKTTFKVRFEANPDFELGDYRSLTIEEPIHRVNDEEINEQLDRILESNGPKEPAQEIENLNSIVKVEFELKPAENSDTAPEPPADFELDLKDDRYPKDLLEYPHPNGALSIYRIKEIQKIVPLVADSDTIKTLSQDKFDNVDDFKQEIGFQLQEKWDEKAREAMETNLIDKLVEMHSFETPTNFYKESLVKYSIDFYKQQKVKLTEADVMEEFPMFEKYFGETVNKGIRWNFISDKIIQKEKIEIEDTDIDDHIENISKMFPGVPIDNLNHIIRSNDEFKSHILNKKLMDLLLDFSTTEEIEFDEYMQKQYQKNEMERIEKLNQVNEEIEEQKTIVTQESQEEESKPKAKRKKATTKKEKSDKSETEKPESEKE